MTYVKMMYEKYYVCDYIYEYMLNESLSHIINLLFARPKFTSEGISSYILAAKSRSLYQLHIYTPIQFKYATSLHTG